MPKNNRKSNHEKLVARVHPTCSYKIEIQTTISALKITPPYLDTGPPRTVEGSNEQTRNASVRSEIYTRSQSAELKKLGILSLGIIVI
ncbi:MAG: hypothetical protein Ct9H300mP19_10980 [Dehalococcoidia bacterium]|nr:MAG: hypothetical protein Ct9H300mP19_10980 [Dehalococcoidia bacterium]